MVCARIISRSAAGSPFLVARYRSLATTVSTTAIACLHGAVKSRGPRSRRRVPEKRLRLSRLELENSRANSSLPLSVFVCFPWENSTSFRWNFARVYRIRSKIDRIDRVVPKFNSREFRKQSVQKGMVARKRATIKHPNTIKSYSSGRYKSGVAHNPR